MSYVIGQGVQDAINAAGDEARLDETYLNKPGQPAVSLTVGRDGLYVYVGEDNRTHRIPFDS